MNGKFFSLIFAAMFLIANFVSAADIQGNGYVEVKGIKYYDKNQSLDALQRMAVLVAYQKLAEEIGDLHITSSSTMTDFTSLDDTVKATVEKTVRGAKVISNVRDAEGNFTATVRLNIFGGANSLANIIVPKDIDVEPFPSFDPKFETIDSNYTGLIIDCAGQEISTAILPKIKSVSGKEVYAFQFLERNVVIGRGMVNYSDGSNNSRAGNNPLTIQAMFVENCDIVVSDDDAEKILAVNSKSNFLKNCMVVFVK